MPEQLPEKYADLLKKKAFANLGTLNRDGSPQVTPVWVDYDGKHVRVNTALGRVKDKNMRRNRHVAFSIQDPDDPYRFIAVRGEIVEITDNTDDHINALAKKYINQDKYPYKQPNEVRVTYKIRPDHVLAWAR